MVPPLWISFTAFLFCAYLAAGEGDEYFVTAEDETVAQRAKERAGEMCGKDFEGHIDRAEGYQGLKNIMGDTNELYAVFKNAESNEELREDLHTSMDKYLRLDWMIGAFWPLGLCIFVFVLYFGICWTIWPCCEKARRPFGHRIHEISPVVKYVLCGIVVVCVIVVIVMIAQTAVGLDRVKDGTRNLGCSSSVLLDRTLSGQTTDPQFLGLLPALKIIKNFHDLLNDDSDVMIQIETILGGTDKIISSVAVLNATLMMFGDMMAVKENKEPKSLDGRNLEHTNMLADVFSSTLAEPVKMLKEQPAKAILDEQTRKVKESYLSPEKRSEMQQALKATIDPVVQVKDTARTSLAWMMNMEEDVYQQLDNKGFLFGADLSFLKALFVLVGFSGSILLVGGLGTTLIFIFREMSKTRLASGDNPYSYTMHRVAGFTWCWGFIYAATTLFFGGVILAACVPVSGVCMLMQNLSETIVLDIGPALGLELWNKSMNPPVLSETGEMVVDIIDGCFAHDINAGKASKDKVDILEIVNVPSYLTSDGEQKSMHAFFEETKQMIKTKFETFMASSDMSDQLMSMGFSDIQRLQAVLKGVSISQMTMPTKMPELIAGSMFDKFYFHGIQQGGSECEDLPVLSEEVLQTFHDKLASVKNGKMLDRWLIDNRTWVGMKSFYTGTQGTLREEHGLAKYGKPKTVDACSLTQKPEVMCGVEYEYNTKLPPKDDGSNECVVDPSNRYCQFCMTWNAIFEYKYIMRTEKIFRCDLWEQPDAPAAYCDILDMAEDSDGWKNDCMSADGFLKAKERWCTLPEFSTYVQQFDTRFEVALERVLETVAGVQTNVTTTMRNLVETHVITTMDEVKAGFSCGFLSDFFQETIDGLCYQNVRGWQKVGISYSIGAVMVLIMTGVSYFLWRVAIDNRNQWNTEHDPDAARV